MSRGISCPEGLPRGHASGLCNKETSMAPLRVMHSNLEMASLVVGCGLQKRGGLDSWAWHLQCIKTRPRGDLWSPNLRPRLA